jgi:curved DNA-binding protein CbpA
MFGTVTVMDNYYQVLELPPNASPRRIREQYRKLAKQYHPDRTSNPNDKVRFAEKFKEITQAYAVLSEIVRRGRLGPVERKLHFLYQQGQTLLAQKQWSRALMVFNEIIAIDPSYRDTLGGLRQARRMHRHLAGQYAKANAMLQQKRWAEAMAAFEEVLKEDPNYRDASKQFKKARRERLMQDFIKQY